MPIQKIKKGNGSHKKESSNKLQNGSRNKPEALLPVTNRQINHPYRMMPDSLNSPTSPISPNATNVSQNVFVNTMAIARQSPSSPDSVTMEIESDMDSDSTLTPTETSTNMLPTEVRSREAVVEIMEKSIPNYEKMSSQNTFDYSQELPPAIPREHTIDYKSVQNYNPYSTISTNSLPLPSLKEDSLPSPIYQMNEDINIINNSSSKIEPFMKMPSSMNAGQDISSWKTEPPKPLDDDKKIKGILVNKSVTENIDNEGGEFEVVNKKRGKRTHKHSLSFSVPLTSTIEVPLRNKSHKRSSSSSTNVASAKNIESISVNNAILIGNTFNTIDDNVSYSNAVQFSRKQLRKRSISTPIMLDKEQSSQVKDSHPTTNNTISTKKLAPTASMGSNVNHIRRYSTSIIDNKLSYADVLNSNLHFNEDDALKNADSLKKSTKITKNATTRSGGSPTGNAENTKNQSNGNNSSNGSSEQNNNADQSSSQDDNGNYANGNSNSSGNNGNNNGNNNNNNNNNNTNPNAGKGKNKKQKKAKNANGTADENETEETPGTPKKKAAKAKKEAKGKNKVSVDTAAQGKTNGNEMKSPPASKKKAAKAAANAKKKEANKSTEESGLLVTGEITYGKAGLQDEPIPTDEEAYNALFSENATYWTPAERTERIRNSPFYDHNHHIAKYGKIKYKPMVEYDTDMNEINYELEMDEAANEKNKKEDKKEKKKKKKANANVASTSDDKDISGNDTKKGKKKKAANKDDEDNEDTADEKISKSKKKGKAAASSANASGDNDSTQESGKPEESKKAKKKKAKAAKVKAEANESASEIEIPPVPAKAKKLKKAKKVAKKSEVSESEEESDSMSNSLSMSMPIPTPVLAPTATAESSLIYSSNASTSTTNTRSTSPLSQSTTIQYNSNGSEEILVSNNVAGRSSAASLIFNKVSQPSPLSSVSYVNYYDDSNINVHANPHANIVKPNPTPLAQSPIMPIQTPNAPLFGPSSTTPKMDSPTMFSFTNGPSLTISTAPVVQNNDNQGQEETIIDLFNRTNKSFRRPRSISLNSHFQPSNEVRSNLSPLLMSTFKNSSALKLDQPFLPQEQQFNNIKLNSSSSSNLPFEAEAGLFNNNNLSTSYIPPMHSKSSDLLNKETIPAQTNSKSGLSDFSDFGSGSIANPIIKKPTENVIQRYRRARTLSSPAVPPSVDKKNHFYSPFMTGLDIKYDFYIPKSNAISPLSSSFTASDSHTYEMNREETTRRRSQSINERNRPNINDF